jgi:hypothetical protein
MVGPFGLEPQTSTVSKRRDYVLTTTYNALGAAQVRVSTAKTELLQVKLQVKKFDAIVDNAGCFAVRTLELVDYLMAASSYGEAGPGSAGRIVRNQDSDLL